MSSDIANDTDAALAASPASAAPPPVSVQPAPPPPTPVDDGAERERRKEWREKWTLIIAAIGLAINTVGIGFVIVQLNQAGDSISDNTLEQIYSRMHDINKTFIDHPELKPYFYDGLDVGDPNPLIADLNLDEKRVRAQVSPLAETMCDFFAQALIQLRKLPPGAYDGWKRYIQAVYMRSPAMRRYYRENKDWYQYDEAARLFDQADAALKRQQARKGLPVEK